MSVELETVNSYEVERGKPTPSKNHAIVQGNINFYLKLHYREQFRVLPEVSLLLPEGPRVPDLAIFQPIAFDPMQDEVRMEEVPLCAIEILSPTQNLTELLEKAKDYFVAGVKSYWLVTPPLENVHVFSDSKDYRYFGKTETLIDEQLGIELPLKEVFV